MKALERLETKRLILRAYIDSDIKSFSLLIRDELISNPHYAMKDQQTLKDEKLLFSSIINSHYSSKPVFVWAICEKEDEVFIGTCGLKSLVDNLGFECFYALLPRYRGNGFAIEAMLKVLEFSFRDLKIAKIIINIHPNNTRAWKVAERIGMKYMGHIKYKNINSNAMLFSIEEKEYKAQRFY
ncbi:MAG: GNAT family N-acetyltransferase [Promethearchaeota archaeon]